MRLLAVHTKKGASKRIPRQKAGGNKQRMAPKARPKAKARAAAKRVRDEQLARANERQKLRRQAVLELNKLTVDVGMAAAPLCFKTATGDLLEKRVRLLQRKCPNAAYRTHSHSHLLTLTHTH